MIGLLASLLIATTTVTVDHCPDAEEIRRIAEIELANESSPAHVQCEQQLATLEVSGRTRVLSLLGVDERARARLIAIALAELAETEARTPPPPAAPPPVAVAPAAEISAEPHASSRVSVSPELSAGLLYFTTGVVAWGGRAGASLLFNDRFGLRLALGAQLGGRDVSVGRVGLLSVDGGLIGMARLAWDPLALDLGVGLRLGWARLRGDPADATQTEGAEVSGLWMGPMAHARLSLHLGGLALFFESELGAVTRPVIGRIEPAEVVAVDGAFISLGLGIAF